MRCGALALAAVLTAIAPAGAQQFVYTPPLPTLRQVTAALTVTATNTLSALPQPYDGRSCELIVNGHVLSDKDVTPSFSCAGTTATWNATNAGYALPVGMSVTVRETY